MTWVSLGFSYILIYSRLLPYYKYAHVGYYMAARPGPALSTGPETLALVTFVILDSHRVLEDDSISSGLLESSILLG